MEPIIKVKVWHFRLDIKLFILLRSSYEYYRRRNDLYRCEIYKVLKMLRGHGLLRESDSKEFQEHNIKKFPELNKISSFY